MLVSISVKAAVCVTRPKRVSRITRRGGKGKSQALIAHEATLQLQHSPQKQPQELLFGESETSAELQAEGSQCKLDLADSSNTQKDEVGPAVSDTSSVDTVRPLGGVTIINHPGFIMFGTKRIRKTDKMPQQVSVYDLITAITNVNSNSAAAKAFFRIQDKPTTQMFKFPGGGKDTLVADIPACKKIAIQVLAGARMSLKQKNAVLKALGMAEAVLMRTYIEEETLEPVIEVFSSLSPVKQFSCGPYLIDLYFPNQKIALECDEEGHSRYNADDEMKRQKFLEAQLSCTFVRYNPHAADFSVISLVAQLMPMLTLARCVC